MKTIFDYFCDDERSERSKAAPSAPVEALKAPAAKERSKAAPERSAEDKSKWAKEMAALSAAARKKRKEERSRQPSEALKSA